MWGSLVRTKYHSQGHGRHFFQSNAGGANNPGRSPGTCRRAGGIKTIFYGKPE
jgi:hypothetical protein